MTDWMVKEKSREDTWPTIHSKVTSVCQEPSTVLGARNAERSLISLQQSNRLILGQKVHAGPNAWLRTGYWAIANSPCLSASRPLAILEDRRFFSPGTPVVDISLIYLCLSKGIIPSPPQFSLFFSSTGFYPMFLNSFLKKRITFQEMSFRRVHI